MSQADRLLSPLSLQVRTVSAKALGAMVKGMGESCFDDLLPWLMETLASEQSSVDRSGAAQGGSSPSPSVPPDPLVSWCSVLLCTAEGCLGGPKIGHLM